MYSIILLMKEHGHDEHGEDPYDVDHYDEDRGDGGLCDVDHYGEDHCDEDHCDGHDHGGFHHDDDDDDVEHEVGDGGALLNLWSLFHQFLQAFDHFHVLSQMMLILFLDCM